MVSSSFSGKVASQTPGMRSAILVVARLFVYYLSSTPCVAVISGTARRIDSSTGLDEGRVRCKPLPLRQSAFPECSESYRMPWLQST